MTSTRWINKSPPVLDSSWDRRQQDKDNGENLPLETKQDSIGTNPILR